MEDNSSSSATGERRKSSLQSSKKLSLFSRKGLGVPETIEQNISKSEGLEFKDICVDVAAKRILWSVSGHARPGHVLAILGPSGSGKTTLLNTLAGQLKKTSGTITFNGHKLTRKDRRKTSYVLQADIFFPNLTLRETIRYSALLRLPREYSFREKLNKVEAIIKTLHLEDCAETIIGGPLVRGLSGGEKKRANIGCELLTDPSLLLLDEPTSGLDSSSALNLMEILVNVASDGNKTVVTSIHQPSSQLFHMFDRLLLMAKGKVAYFGKASDAMDYVASVGLRCTMHYNPADYLLELVSVDSSRKVLIGEDPKQEERPMQKKWWQRLFNRSSKPLLPPPQADDEEKQSKEAVQIEEYASSPRVPRPQTHLPDVMILDPPEDSGMGSSDSSSQDEKDTISTSSSVEVEEGRHIPLDRKWATRWYWQFLVLTVRTFRESRHNLLSILNLFQAFLLAVVCSLIWFQVPKVERSISDGYGYLFFSIVFWSFNSTFGAAFTFPNDHVVVTKERASGMYHLSAYFMAKLLSELPLMLFTPSLFHVITYFIVGLNGADGFFGTWLSLIITCLVGQSLGLFLGAVIMDLKRIIVYGSVVVLTFMLLGGFYVQSLPFWLQWAQYTSFITYSFRASLQFNYPSHIQYSCAEMSEYAVCTNATFPGNATISGTDIQVALNVDTPLYANILILLLFALVVRYAAYLGLRYLHRRKN